MAPSASLNLRPTKQLRSAVKATSSVTERSGFPPKPTNSVTKASNLVTGRLVSSSLNLIKQLVFTEFGLSPVITMPSPELSLLPAEPYTPPKPESPRSHPQPKIKANNGCRCKQSRCLKLYCECFAAGAYCDGCNCSGCRNNADYEALRQVAVKSILDRNPFAFSPKIASSPSIAQDSGDDMKNVPVMGKHNRGCGCKKTECLKKYCECYHAKVFCSENCKCVDCKNFEGCVERKALFKRDYNDTQICKNFAGCEEKMVFSHNNDTNVNKESGAVTDRNHRNADICKSFQGCKEKMTSPGGENNKRKICIQQTNAAISTAIGLTGNSFLRASRKRKFHEFLHSNAKDPPNQRLINDQKEANPLRVSGALSASSVDPVDHVVCSTLGSSKFHYRSLLADKINSREVEQLCSFLVLVSEGAKVLTDTQAMGESETANILEVQEMENCQEVSDVQKVVPDDHLSGNHADAVNTNNLISGCIDIKEERPSYVGKLALSDKKDGSVMGAKRLDQILKNGYQTDVYIKQEKLVLASFRNCLRKIITVGNMEEPMACQCQHVDNPLQKTDLQHE